MYNATNSIIAAAIAASSLLYGCTGSNNHKKAGELLAKARTQLQANYPDSALALLDSIDKNYGTEIDIRREGMALRADAMTASLQQRIYETDSLILVYQAETEKLMPMFEHVGAADANGYFYMKGAFGQEIGKSTGIQARVSDIDYSFYIVAANSGKKIGIDCITLSSPAGAMSTPVIGDSRRGDTDEFGTDLATFSPAEVDSLGSWAYHLGSSISSATLSGPLGSMDIKLSGPQASQFGNAWRLGLIGSRLVTAMRLKEKLDRQLILARDHAANLSVGDDSPSDNDIKYTN